MTTRRSVLLLLSLTAAAVLLTYARVPLLSLRAQEVAAIQPQLTIGGYQLVSQRRISPTHSEYTLTAVLTNAGPALERATARVTSLSARTQIVDPDLTFGVIPRNGSGSSQDTFSIRRNRLLGFNPADLFWTVTGVPANQRPRADIRPVGPVFVTQPVTLDGRGSSDPDGHALTYRWSLVQLPPGSRARINAAFSPTATVLPDRSGRYVVRLRVSDGRLADTATLTFTTSNSPPHARAGADQTVAAHAVVALDGTDSFDVDGDALSYQWSLAAPAGSAATLSDATAVRPTFVADVVGRYVLSLVVDDGQAVSEPDEAIVTTRGSAPVADAGRDRTVPRGALVVLDGSGSSDVDGDPLTYFWEFIETPAGTTAVLSDAISVQPTFVADRRGNFRIRLTVRDRHGSSEDVVTITTENTRPVANAGTDRIALPGTMVVLDGSGSTDVDGDPLSYQWSLTTVPLGSAAVLLDASTLTPSFLVDLAGEYVAQLIVNDGLVASEPDTVIISPDNARPVADAGLNQSVRVGATVQLDASGSIDPDGDPLQYTWSLITVPPGSTAVLNDVAAIAPIFVADQPGVYLAQLIVHDGRLPSAPDTVTITTAEMAVPVADAGPDQSNVPVGALVMLDGSASSDADGHTLTFQWSMLSVPPGSAAALLNAATIQPTFVADIAGRYVAQLIVDDGFAQSPPDTVVIETAAVNRPPAAVAGSDQSTMPGVLVSLDGSGSSDPDGDLLTYHWTLTAAPAGSAATLLDVSASNASLTPDLPGVYEIALVVNDGTADSDPDVVLVIVSGTAAEPTITGFTPSSGQAGDVVTITGANFTGTQAVAFNGVTAAQFTILGSTSITVTVPPAATTGPITVMTPAGSATSPGQFVVVPRQDFQLTAAPEAITVAPGGQGAFQISLQGTGGFSNLATLSVDGVPGGFTAAFDAPTLTSGQSTPLTVQTPAGAAGNIPLTVRATGLVDDIETTRSATVTLQMAAAGTTSIAGRFLTVDEVPIPNVLVQIAAVQTHSDAAGNFLLQNVLEGAQALMIDANVAVAGYPIYKVDLQITAGQLLTLPPFRITPPPPPERYTPFDNATQDQIITDPRYPGFELTLPRGASIIGWDGTPKSRVAIERILPSELPVPPPPGPTQSLYQIHFGTPMGGIPSARLPVTLPNDQGLEPGQQGEIWWYDAAPTGGPGAWKMAGMGTVSADGTRVVSNPGVGIDRFCGVCGLVCFINRILGQDNRNPDSPTDGDPVDLALGQMIVDKTDMVLPGRRAALVHRTYNPLDPFGAIAGYELALGPGWALSVDVVLLEVNTSLRRLIMPGNARFDFVVQPNGTYTQGTHQRFAGAVLTALPGGTNQIRFKDGTVWRFANTSIPGLEALVEESDRNGNRLAIERSFDAVIRRIVEPSGRALTFSYSGDRLSQVTDPLGRVVRYGYNSAGRLETVTDAAGGTTRYTYNAAGGILTITDPSDIEYLRNEYSPLSGRILRQIQADGGVWNFKYLVLPRVLAAVPLALNPAPVEESAASVAAGLAGDLRNPPISTTVVDPRGNSRTYSLFAGFADAVTDALGQRTRLERDGRGQVISTTDPLNRVTRLEYDALGNVTRITDPAGQITSFDYELTFSQVTRITDALGNVTTFSYDARGNLTSIINPEQNARGEAERLAITVAYDDVGQPSSATDTLGNVTAFAYDARGNLASVVDGLGNSSHLDYDSASRVVAQTDPRGRTTRFAYDALNQIAAITDALGGETTFGYDGNGNVLSVTDASGNTVEYEYDSMDRVTRRTDPLGRAETFAYDANGNMTTAVDRKGQTTTFTYDKLDREVRTQFADGASVEFDYDAAGRLISADDSADPHRPITYTYDVLDRVVSETTLLGTAQYTYDALGRRTQTLASGAELVSYAYDRNSQLRTITQGSLGAMTFEYDAADRRTSLTLPNGVSTEYQYRPGLASHGTDLP